MPKKTIPKKKKRSKISPQDLFRLRVTTGLEISPDEKKVAYCVERMDKKERKYFTNIHMLEVDIEDNGDNIKKITLQHKGIGDVPFLWAIKNQR